MPRLDALPRVPDDVSPAEARALLAVCRADLAVVNLAGLAWCRAEIAALADRGARSYVVAWTPRGTKDVWVTLTPYGADRLGVDLDEIGADERPVWTPEAEPTHASRPVRLPKHVHRALPRPELVPAPLDGEMSFAWTVPIPPRDLMRRLDRKIRAARKSKKQNRKRKQVKPSAGA